MAEITADRVLESSTTTGTGSLTLAGAITGYRAFSAVCANGDTVRGYIEAVDANGIPTGDWEVGIYTWGTGGILARTTVQASSNAGSAVSFAAGTKRVGLGVLASKLTPSFTWSGKPSASSVLAGTQIRITDVGISSAGSLWFSDGTNYRPAGGSVSLYKRSGPTTSPLASLTPAGANNTAFSLPGGPVTIPAGLIVANGSLWVQGLSRRTPTNDAVLITFRLGTSGTPTSNASVGSSYFGNNGQTNPLLLRATFSSSSTCTVNGNTNDPFNQGFITEKTTLIDTTSAMTLSVLMETSGTTDTYEIYDLHVWVEQ
jgi:hypothetical protein